MSNEEKDLLLKDLSARLPYGVIIDYKGILRPLFNVTPTQHFQITLDYSIDGKHNGLVYVSLDVDGTNEVRPYLRPMSSMTEDEKKEFSVLAVGTHLFKGPLIPSYDTLDWLNAHHFDYRELIEKGLALEAPEGMYNLK